MGKFTIDNLLEDFDRAMREVKDSLRGIPVRRAGFKKDHDELARSIASLGLFLSDARCIIAAEKKARKRR